MSIQAYGPIILTAALLAFLATPVTRLLAQRMGMVDQPGLRKAHRLPVPLLGGVAIYTALIAAFLAFGRAWLVEGLGILGGGTLLFITGLWDDRYGMPARAKLAATLVAAMGLILSGVQTRLFGVWWVDWPITLLWVAGITNAVNLMDNMDGLAAGVAAVAAAFFFFLAVREGLGLVAALAAALFGAAAGFLFYNFAPAVSFMGDAGSLTLGFMLAALGIKIKFPSWPLATTWMVPIVILGTLIFDTALVVISRLRRGRSIFQGGSDHTSHRLVALGLSQPRAVLVLYVVSLTLGILAVYLSRATVPTANGIFVIVVCAGAVGLWLLERVEPRLSGDPWLVLIPGGGGMVAAINQALAISRNLVVLLAPRRGDGGVHPSREEVIGALAALTEEPAVAQKLLEQGLDEQWWRVFPHLNSLWRLRGEVVLVYTDPDVATAEATLEGMAAIRRAAAFLFGPGDPQVNVLPALVAPALERALGHQSSLSVWLLADGESAPPASVLASLSGRRWITVPVKCLEIELQRHLLAQAANRPKTQE